MDCFSQTFLFITLVLSTLFCQKWKQKLHCSYPETELERQNFYPSHSQYNPEHTESSLLFFSVNESILSLPPFPFPSPLPSSNARSNSYTQISIVTIY